MVADSYPILEGHLQAGRLDQAESVARHILSIEPEDMVGRCGLARVTAAHGRHDDAVEMLEELVAEAPRDPLPMAYLAVLAQARGEPERALTLARRASDLGARVAAIDVMLGDQAYVDEDLDEALGFYEAALARDPESSGAWHGKGRVLRDMQELVLAEDAFVQAVQYGPERVAAWVDLVALEQDAGAHEVAAENLVLALRAHPGHPELLRLKEREEAASADPLTDGELHIRMAIYEGDLDRAFGVLDRLVEAFPDEPRLAVARAEVCLASDQASEVTSLIHELTRLVRVDVMAWEPRLALGRLLLREGPLQNTRLALAHCEDAWRMSGEHPHAGIGLVEAWAATGKRAYARALLGRLAENESPEGQRARAILAGEIA